MNTEATPVYLAMVSQEDFQRNIITMFKRDHLGNLVVHKRIRRDKIIEGNDLIVKKEESNGGSETDKA